MHSMAVEPKIVHSNGKRRRRRVQLCVSEEWGRWCVRQKVNDVSSLWTEHKQSVVEEGEDRVCGYLVTEKTARR